MSSVRNDVCQVSSCFRLDLVPRLLGIRLQAEMERLKVLETKVILIFWIEFCLCSMNTASLNETRV